MAEFTKKETSLSSTNLFNLSESILGLFSFCLFLISVLRNYNPTSLVTRLLASSLIPPPPESYSPAIFNCLSLSRYLCMYFTFPHSSPSCDKTLFLLQAPDFASNLNPQILSLGLLSCASTELMRPICL